MSTNDATIRKFLSRDLTETLIRVGLIAFLVVLCARVFAPFANLVVWGLILAIALEPLHGKLAAHLGGRQGLSATLLMLAGLLLLGVPTVMLGSSFASHLHDLYIAVENGSLAIRPPDPDVAGWPVIGGRLYDTWSSAATNLPAVVADNRELLTNLSRQTLDAAADTAGAILLFLGSMIVAAIIMTFALSGTRAMQAIFSRLTDPVRGPRLQQLATATVRSVAAGVIGVAFIQSILLGMGFLLAGIPAAGVLAVVVMFIGILQIPAAIVSLPAVIYVWWLGDGSTASKILFTSYFVVAGMADNVLKPLLLGRGVDAPMPVILMGALGGMVTGGIIGLFLGGVLLAVSYRLFMEWVDDSEAALSAEPGQSVAGARG
jgi:predicted PurR-regulated permease PerM